MKNRITGYLSLVMAFGLILSACETDIEKANAAYDFNAVVPEVLGMTGPTSVSQTFSQMYYVTYYRAGSTWNWSTSDNATIDSTSSNGGHDCYVNFPTDGTVEIYVTETTQGGLTSDPDTLMVTVLPFCPLDDYNDLAGNWTGSDSEGYDTQVVTTVVGGSLMIEGLNHAWMEDYWGETVTDQVALEMTMNEDGTLVIDRQYVMTTDWNGDPYRYEISGVGTWDNCVKSLYIEYTLYYEGDTDAVTTITEDITLVP